MPTRIPQQCPNDNRNTPVSVSNRDGGGVCSSTSNSQDNDDENPRQQRQCRQQRDRRSNNNQQLPHRNPMTTHHKNKQHSHKHQHQHQHQASAKNPKPPPSATQVQLGLWERILKHRTEQIHDLSPSFFLSYANDITLQLKNSQRDMKDHSTSLKHPQLAGVYSSHLLTTHPPPPNLTRISVVRHLQALFFRSIDDRLPFELRQHGIDGLMMALKSLDAWMAKFENYCEAYRLKKEEEERKKTDEEKGNQLHQLQQQQDQETEAISNSSTGNGDQSQAGKRKSMEGTSSSSSDKQQNNASDPSSDSILAHGARKRSRGYDICNDDNRRKPPSSLNDTFRMGEAANTNTAEFSSRAVTSTVAALNTPSCPANAENLKATAEVSKSTTGKTATSSSSSRNLVVRPVVPRTGKTFLPPQPLEPAEGLDSDDSSLFSSDLSVQKTISNSKSMPSGISRETDTNTERPKAQAADDFSSGEKKQFSNAAKSSNNNLTVTSNAASLDNHGNGKQLPTNSSMSATNATARIDSDIDLRTGGQKTQTTLRAEPTSSAAANTAAPVAMTKAISADDIMNTGVTNASASSNSSHNAPTKRKAPDSGNIQPIDPPQKRTTKTAQPNGFCSSGNKKPPHSSLQLAPSTKVAQEKSNTTGINSNNNSDVANATTASLNLSKISVTASLTSSDLSSGKTGVTGNTEQINSVQKRPAIIQQSKGVSQVRSKQTPRRGSCQTPALTPAASSATAQTRAGTAARNSITNPSKPLATAKEQSELPRSASVNQNNIQATTPSGQRNKNLSHVNNSTSPGSTNGPPNSHHPVQGQKNTSSSLHADSCNNEVHSVPTVQPPTAKSMTKSSVPSTQAFRARPIVTVPILENSQKVTANDVRNSILQQKADLSLGSKGTTNASHQHLVSPIRMVVPRASSPLATHAAEVDVNLNSITSTAKHFHITETILAVPKKHNTPKSSKTFENTPGHQESESLPKTSVSNAERASAPSDPSDSGEMQAPVLGDKTHLSGPVTADDKDSSHSREVLRHCVVNSSDTAALACGQVSAHDVNESNSERKEDMPLERIANNKKIPSATDSGFQSTNDTNEVNGSQDASKSTDIHHNHSKFPFSAESGDCDSDIAVLDLTDDSPLREPLPQNDQEQIKDVSIKRAGALKNVASSTNDRPPSLTTHTKPSIQNRLPSPPPSPPPKTRILRILPPPRPQPSTFCSMRNLHFPADKRDQNSRLTSSSGLKERSYCLVNYDAGFHLDGSGTCMDDKTRIDIRNRLETWDPYWNIVEELGTKQVRAQGSGNFDTTTVGTRTSSCRPVQIGPNPPSFHPSSCAFVCIDLPTVIAQSSNAKSHKTKPWGVRWGELANPPSGRLIENYKTGDRRLIVRTLPLHRTNCEKKRADTHIWPKGSFVTLVIGDAARTQGEIKPGSSESVMTIFQRKQQSHDHNLWKGNSHAMDLTKCVSDPKKHPIGIKLGSVEVVENKNGDLLGSYAIHVAICEYVGADTLHDQLMGKIDGGSVLIPTLSLRSAKKLAKEYIANQTVSIDNDEIDDGNVESNKGADITNSLTFSLLCPMSKQTLETPVRGRHCRHMQCFDLRNFLCTNEIVSGGRWRCGVCEDFLSVRDLIHCGLFQAMLDEYRDSISGSRDKVSDSNLFYLKVIRKEC